MAPSATATGAPIPVTIAWNKVAGQIIGPVAVAKGFDRDFGVAMTLVPYGDSSTSIQSTITGQSDGAFAATVPTGPSLISKGAPIKAVMIYAYGGNRFGLVVLASSGITSLSQLAGKRIATVLGAAPEQFTDAVLLGVGIDPKSVQLINMNYPDMPAALATHQIDVATILEPTLSQYLLKEPTAKVLVRGGDYVDAAASVYFSASFLKAPNQAALKTYLALARAAQYIRQVGASSDEIAQIGGTATGVTVDVAKLSQVGTVFDPRIKPWTWTQVQKDMAFFVKLGNLTQAVTEEQLFDLSLQGAALKDHPELFSDLDSYLKAQNVSSAEMVAP